MGRIKINARLINQNFPRQGDIKYVAWQMTANLSPHRKCWYNCATANIMTVRLLM
jgi:hypothetical protein